MAFKTLSSIACALIASLMLSSASAVTVNWAGLGLDESAILSVGGQTITDFAGIPGLDAVVIGSANLRAPSANSIASFTHLDGNLFLRTQLVPGDVDPISITFSFNHNVSFMAGMHYFGDASVKEEFRWSSNSGIFDATVAGDNAITGDLTSLVRLTSGSNGTSDLAQVSSASISDVTIALGGFNFTGLAGSTVNMELELAAVPVPASVWLFISGLLGIVGITRRKALL